MENKPVQSLHRLDQVFVVELSPGEYVTPVTHLNT